MKKATETVQSYDREQAGFLHSRLFLFLTEFFSGMAVMAVELGASRLLAPYFSSSQIVWTIIIGTIMIAMALGNLWGGRSADRNPDPDRLYRRILLASVWIAAIPLVGRYIIVGITGLLIVTIDTGLLIRAAFLACMILFVFPLFLLGTVTPSLVKYATQSLDRSGSTAGSLGAFNTIGSILGTFLPTFVTIPAVGTAVTFLLFSGILLLIGTIYFLEKHRGRKVTAVALILFILCSIFGSSDRFAFWEDNLTFEGESVYNYLQVRDTGDRTILSTNVLFGVQSVRMKTDRLTGMYYDYALAAPVMADLPQKGSSDVLVLGMGTGTFALQCDRYFPGIAVEGVEIDPAITDLARRYFALPETIPVTTCDGRAYLQASDKTWDVIMVDAYQDITIPFPMSTVEFFHLVKEHLNPGGVMAVNLNMHSDRSGSINEYLCDTIAAVFPCVCSADVPGTTNREVFASAEATPDTLLRRNLSAVDDRSLRTLLETVADQMEEYHSGGHRFTDDRAPVELMGMKVIDGLIQNELEYYKAVFRREGLRGILAEVNSGE